MMRTILTPLLLFLLFLLLFVVCATTTEAKKSWKVERTWEKQVASTTYDPEGPWPLLTPKRDEKTVLFKFHYGKDYNIIICQQSVDDTNNNNNNNMEETFDDDDDIDIDIIEVINSIDQQQQRLLNEEEEGEEHEEGLSVHVTYEDIYDTLIFLTAAWIAGHIALLLGMPTLVGEIVVGFLLGPPLADFVPQPEAMVLIGEVGLIGLLLEAGIEMDVAQLKETGARSLGMAVTGATIPMLMGVGLTFAYGGDIRSAIALGACFSPTSLGVASNALNAGNVANTPVGQLIVSTCVLDDIIGLILLGMLQVIVKEDAQVWEYFIPIISSVGYLLVLGWSGLTWMPKLIENRILPRFPERLRDTIVFFMMMMLLLAYLPLLYYSKSSYLTGAFLAGLTFSQIHSIHSTFANEMGSLMNWLLRIFFAASIGFQVPITKFGDSDIVKWGFIFYVCVLGKLPLGFFVPRFQLTIPDGFPFNPYVRDFIYVSVAMTCRGEFSFVIASFALQEGLFSTEMYSSVVFAVLLSCITSPFALLSIIKYYNRKSEAFLESLLDEKDADGKIPLYLAIQVRTPNQWGLQETIQSALKRAGLVVIDHRSWHPRGMDADVMTELYVEDTELRVPKKKMTEISQSFLDVEGTIREEDVSNVMEAVDDRCAVVKKALEDLLGHADQTRVVVTWWQPTSINQEDASDANEALGDRLKTEAQSEMTTHERFGLQLPQPRRRRERTLSVPKIGQDMWGSDVPAKDAAFSDAYSPQPPSKVMAGRYRYGQRRKIQSDLTGFMFMEAAPSTEEHLAGLVRRDNEQSTEFGMLHPGDRHASVKDLRVQREKTKSDVTGLFDRRSTSWLPRGKAKSDLSGLDIQGGIKEEEKEDEDNSRAGG